MLGLTMWGKNSFAGQSGYQFIDGRKCQPLIAFELFNSCRCKLHGQCTPHLEGRNKQGRSMISDVSSVCAENWWDGIFGARKGANLFIS